MAFAHKTDLGVIDCLSGSFVLASQSPFVIGSGASCNVKLNDDSVLDQHCLIEKTKKGIQVRAVQPEHPSGQIVLDGVHTPVAAIQRGTEYSLQVGKSFLVIGTVGGGATEALQRWAADVRNGGWIINKTNRAIASQPLPNLDAVFEACTAMNLNPDTTPVFKGASQVGFYVRQLMVLDSRAAAPEPEEDDELEARAIPVAKPVTKPAAEATPFLDDESGEFTCPVCWLHFDRGDVMHIASHESLFGDPVLGEEHMRRFQAKRFNNRGQALDDKGVPCVEIACPHCRRALPSGFFNAPHRIFSIVGAPSSGKSYYLSVLVKLLQTTLANKFGIAFRDADPTGNAPLNEMKSHLFSAQSPAQAFLTKTQLEGEMYERLPRYDRMVTLPRPFVYSLSRSASGSGSNGACSLVFYDNAGEHFQPGQDSIASPGAQHIASSDAIFFLFDPTTNPEFRKRLKALDDPQFASEIGDQQDVILAETEVRIKKLLGLDRSERVDTPMAMIIGKCDAWIDELGDNRLRDPVVDGTVDLGAIEENSALVRAFMEETCPHIVANADTISSEVMYFASSAFGHTPVTFEDERGISRIGPDPSKINPMYVEIPTLWALSKIQSELVPSFR